VLEFPGNVTKIMMQSQPGYFMNCCRETTKMGVPPGNHPAVPRDWSRGVPERYVAGADTRERQEGRPYPWSQQVIHEISRLSLLCSPACLKQWV